MSDWEDFCDANGFSNDADGYENFLDSLEGSGPSYIYEDEELEFFETFREASEWAKANVGKAFTRAFGGRGFVPK